MPPPRGLELKALLVSPRSTAPRAALATPELQMAAHFAAPASFTPFASGTFRRKELQPETTTLDEKTAGEFLLFS